MAGTNFTDVYDMFMVTVQDYQLDKLYQTSADNLNTFLQSFLKYAINDVSGFCDIPNLMEDADFTAGEFSVDIGQYNVILLAEYMKRSWAKRQIDYVTQLQALLTDTDFKRFSEANNLQAKIAYYGSIEENLGRVRAEYVMQHKVNFKEWKTGVYDGDV